MKLFFAVFLGFFAISAIAQTEDTTPAVLTSAALAPAAVDVSAGPQTVTVTIHVTDNLSGFQQGFFGLTSPSGAQSVFGAIGQLVSGTPLDGTYQGQIAIPQFSESGAWHFGYLRIDDLANNIKLYFPPELEAIGINPTVMVSGGPDLAPPALVSASLSPASLDVTGAAGAVTVTIHVQDAPSGFQQGFFGLTSPSGAQSVFGQISQLVSGDSHDGTYQSQITIPRYSESGAWHFGYLRLDDVANNIKVLFPADLDALGVSPVVHVTSIPDTAAPALAGVTLSPAAIDVSTAAQIVTVTIHVQDALSGFQQGFFGLISPSGAQSVFGFIGQLVSGDPNDGIYQGQVAIPQFSENGAWHFSYLRLDDAANNIVLLFELSPTVVVSAGPVQATANLIATITNAGLPGSLTAPLDQVAQILNDGNPNNDGAACGKLNAFLNQVEAKLQNGQLTAAQAAQLTQAANAIKTSLGCA